ncbi:hypothetical protein SC08_Contig83orf01751 [Clostridium butyricum]|nr:hypothetical protein SC08_Contig83orf01751 [Clostridium butyricum]
MLINILKVSIEHINEFNIISLLIYCNLRWINYVRSYT